VKAHAGTQGNEIADKLAEAAANTDLVENYNRIPKRVVRTKIAENSMTWQDQWDTTKETITKDYFPIVNKRLKFNIRSTVNLTTIITGHGNIRLPSQIQDNQFTNVSVW
jgi:hypothetical protein